MTVGTAWSYNSAAYDRGRFLPAAVPQRVFGGAALACVALSCAWALCTNMSGSSADNGAAVRGDPLAFAASRGDRLAVEGVPGPDSAAAGTINFDSRFAAAFPPGVYLGSKPFAADAVADAEAPAPVTPDLARGPRIAEDTPASAPLSLAPRGRRHGMPRLAEIEQQPDTVASAEPEKPSLFQRLFGEPTPSIFAKLFGPSKATLAYASSDDGVASDGAGVTSGLYDRQTAVYDISTHTVYLPNGTTLEAHSGLGSRLDDPRFVADRDVGPTPPDIYDLRPRERLFHGVQALRLIPVDEKKVFGRAGLLAHSYMLGPNGQSNGCVSFKDYSAFLQAYQSHEITRLAVVSHL